MNKTGFGWIATQKNSLFALCLLGGVSTLGTADVSTLSEFSSEAEGKTTHDNKHKESNDSIKKAVAIMLAENKNKKAIIDEPFEENAYYKQAKSSLKLTQLEVGEQIRQEVALAMVSEGMETTSALSDELLTELIRKEVIRALNVDKSVSESTLGWVYLGRFKDNKWLSSPLKIDGRMPEKGKKYTITGDVNIRKGSSAFQPVTYVLQANTNVQLMDVVKRGNKGHYWAKVSML